MNIPYTENTNLLEPRVFHEVRQHVETHIDDLFTALSIVLFRKGELILEASWGWVNPDSAEDPATPASLFDLASITKTFTVTAFLSLVSDGHVDLDDKLVDVIPEFGQTGPRQMDGGQDPHTRHMLPIPMEVVGKLVDPDVISFRHLLTHTSGLAPWRAVFHEAGGVPPTPDKADPITRQERFQRGLTAICEYPFVAEPGSAIRYSDLGVILLGEAIARLGERPLGKVLSDRVLVPLQLDDILYNPIQNGRTRSETVATEYDAMWRKRRCWGEVHDENARGLGGIAGHAGLFGTARKVAEFGTAWLLKDTRLNVAPELMSLAVLQQAREETERRGLGWQLQMKEYPSVCEHFSDHSFGHTGFTGTSLWIDPHSNLVAVCLSNRVYVGRHKEGFNPFRQRLHSILLS